MQVLIDMHTAPQCSIENVSVAYYKLDWINFLMDAVTQCYICALKQER